MSKQYDKPQRPAYWHETQHSMTRRNDNIDYHRGGTAYMITLHIEERKKLLATMPSPCAATSRSIEAGDALALRPTLKPLGEAMRLAWLTLPERFPEIAIRDRADEWVIMPEHFHGILFIKEDMLEHLSDIEKHFKQRVAMVYRQLLVEGRVVLENKLLAEGRVEPVGQAREWLAAYQALPAEQQEATRAWVQQQLDILYSATRYGTQGDSAPIRICASGKRNKEGFLFAHSYSDKPFWDEETLSEKRHYILNNPLNRAKRQGTPEWLKANRQGIDTALTVGALKGYLHKECRPWQVREPIMAAIERQLLYSATRCRIECWSYGNRELLDRNQHRLLPLVCHRADKALRHKQRAAFLAVAAQGAVTVSACINPDENALFKEIVEAGYPAIKIEDNGFPDVYHPSEERQLLCAEGRYLILTPWRYEYRSEEAVLEVAFCKTMNCVAQAVSRTRDDWWK